MRRDDKFRFSLQWGTDTEEKLQVGALLEQLGNKKSDFIVMAAMDYIRRHPEVAVPGAKIKITCQPVQTREQMLETVKEMARSVIEEYMAGKVITSVGGGEAPETPAGPSEQDLDAMVASLSLFDT